MSEDITQPVLQELMDAFALDLLEGEASLGVPPVALRARLLDSLDQTCRLEDFVDALVGFLDLGAARVREMLCWVDDPARWLETPVPTFSLMHLEPGPSVLAANVGFVRVAAGSDFPHHSHEGEEMVFILQGGLVDVSGAIHRRGACVREPDGSEHSFKALSGPDLIYFVMLERGVTFAFQLDL